MSQAPVVQGLNHITLAVSDLPRSLAFYTGILGMTAHARWRDGAYLSLGTLWFCLSVDTSNPGRDYSHIAFSLAAEDFPAMADRLDAYNVRQWKQNRSEGDSLYILDPDGHKLELHAGDLHSRLASLTPESYPELECF